MDLGAEGGVDDDPPVAQLVAEAFDDDRAVVGDVSAGLALFGQVGEDVVGGPRVESGGQQAQPGVLLGQGAHLAQERADRAAQFERAAELVALPEGQTTRDARRGETSTRSRVMSSMRQELVPRVKTSPTRDSYTISSSSSPTRPPPFLGSEPARKTPKRPRSGIVPPEVTARRWVPGRPVIVPATRSHTTRGRSSAKASDG